MLGCHGIDDGVCHLHAWCLHLHIGTLVAYLLLYFKQVGHGTRLLYLGGCDAVLHVVAHLFLTTALRLLDGLLHGTGHVVGIEYGKSIEISRGTTDGLREASVASQKTFLVGIENGNERYFGQVETFAKKIDTYEHIIYSTTQGIHDADTFQGVHVGMYVGCLDAMPEQVLGKFLCHALGDGGDKHTLLAFYAKLYLLHEVVYLVLGRTNLYSWVEQSGGADKLFNDNAFALLQFEVGRSGGNIYGLWCEFFEFLKTERTVVLGGRQAETIFHKVLLSCLVATVHGAYLWN